MNPGHVMKPVWAVRFARAQAAAVSGLRLHAGLEVCELGDSVWLRGAQLDDNLELQLRKLPAAERFSVLPDQQLLAVGQRVPLGHLPTGPWRPLAAWAQLDVQPAAFCGRVDHPVPLSLVRSTEEAEANLIVTDLASWGQYADEAAEARLRPLAFAVSADGRVLVRGSPLPPLAGQRFVDSDGIAVACGWRTSPPVDASVLRERLDLAAGDLALFAADGSWERVAAEHFIKATRSAVRRTREHVHDG